MRRNLLLICGYTPDTKIVAVGGKQTGAGAASHLLYSGIAVICGGWCAYTEQMVEQGGKRFDGSAAWQLQRSG
jgi:hypothetical protein